MNATKNDKILLKHLELDTLLDITNAINRQPDEQSLLKIFLFTIVANFKISRLVVYSREIKGWQSLIQHGVPSHFAISSPTLYEMASKYSQGREYIPAHPYTDVFDYIIPIGRENRVVAFVFIGGLRKQNDEYNRESLKFIRTIANIITVAIQNIRLNQRRIEQQAIKKEMELARKIQAKLFPQTLPCNDKLWLEATYMPHFSIGGDYYDYIALNQNEGIICVADVSGKGVSAAILMSNLQSALRVLAKQKLDIINIVHELNNIVYENTKGDKFITFFIAKYDLNENSVSYVNCGHNNPILTDYTHQPPVTHVLNKGTVMLGAFEQLPFLELGRIEYTRNYHLFCYTDGLTDHIDMHNHDQALAKVMDALKRVDTSRPYHEQLLHRLNITKAGIDDITLFTCRVIN